MRRGKPGPRPMSIKKLPLLRNFELPQEIDRGITGERLKAWSPDLELVNVDANGKTVIDIFDEIGGDDFFGIGFTSRQMAGALRGAGDVVVNINSPGGSYMEGVAMFNMLVQHPGKVTVNVIGQASSAASIIAMAGDDLNMAPAAVLFIHNVHADAYGDRHDFAEIVDMLAKLDGALGGIYAARSGQTAKKIADMLDAETTLTAEEAVTLGLADKVLDAGAVKASARLKNSAETVRADALVNHALRVAYPGMSRSALLEAKNAIREGKPSAAISTTRNAGLGEVAADIRRLIETL